MDNHSICAVRTLRQALTHTWEKPLSHEPKYEQSSIVCKVGKIYRQYFECKHCGCIYAESPKDEL